MTDIVLLILKHLSPKYTNIARLLIKRIKVSTNLFIDGFVQKQREMYFDLKTFKRLHRKNSTRHPIFHILHMNVGNRCVVVAIC